MFILLLLLKLINFYGFMVVGLQLSSWLTKKVQIPLLNYLNELFYINNNYYEVARIELMEHEVEIEKLYVLPELNHNSETEHSDTEQSDTEHSDTEHSDTDHSDDSEDELKKQTIELPKLNCKSDSDSDDDMPELVSSDEHRDEHRDVVVEKTSTSRLPVLKTDDSDTESDEDDKETKVKMLKPSGIILMDEKLD